MKTMSLERNRQLKVWEAKDFSDMPENELYFEVGIKGDWKQTSHSIGFFDSKEKLISEMAAYFYEDELKRLIENKRFQKIISVIN